MNIQSAIAIFIGGGLGSVARWVIGGGISKLASLSGSVIAGPIGILTANILATLILALLLFTQGSKFTAANSESFLYPLLAIGFCGGFSTFSTFSLDTFKLIQDGNFIWGVLNILVSVLTCLAVAWTVFLVWGKS
ncbi:MAG: fluoride efflux transporter CrcB [Bacteroidota bacterium]|nr:fluoride efflux transporter CrcB [Bacteroidota bacterium]